MGRTAALVILAAAAAPPAQTAVRWREAPELVALFAPVDARASAYRAYVAPVDLDDALRAWTVSTDALPPATAFRPRFHWPRQPGAPAARFLRGGVERSGQS